MPEPVGGITPSSLATCSALVLWSPSSLSQHCAILLDGIALPFFLGQFAKVNLGNVARMADGINFCLALWVTPSATAPNNNASARGLFRARPQTATSVPNVYPGSVTCQIYFPRNWLSLGLCLGIVELRWGRLVHDIVGAVPPRLLCQTQERPAQIFKLDPFLRITLAFGFGRQWLPGTDNRPRTFAVLLCLLRTL